MYWKNETEHEENSKNVAVQPTNAVYWMLCLNVKIPSVYIIEMSNAEQEIGREKDREFGRCKIDIQQNFTIEIYGSNNNRTVYWIAE